MRKQEKSQQTYLPNDRQMEHPLRAACKIRRSVMTIKSKLAMIATSAALGVAALTIGSPAFAQSAYTTGTESSSVSAGYPSPFGSGAYAYAPGVGSRHSSGRNAFAMVPGDPPAGPFLSPSATGGGSLGYN
jgi:hypothetical protein